MDNINEGCFTENEQGFYITQASKVFRPVNIVIEFCLLRKKLQIVSVTCPVEQILI